MILTFETHSASSPFQGRISTPWRTPRSIPRSHALSKHAAPPAPTKAGYSHLGESPSRFRDRTHLEIHDASRLFKRRISTPLRAPRPPRQSHSPSKYTALRVHSGQDIHTPANASFNSARVPIIAIHSPPSRVRGPDTTSKRAPHSHRCSTITFEQHGFSCLAGRRMPAIKAAHPTAFDDPHRCNTQGFASFGHDRYAARARNLAADRAPHPVAPTSLNVRRQSSVASPPASFDSYPAGRRARFPSIRSRR